MLELPGFWSLRDQELYCEEVSLRTIADTYGTPCYVYSANHIRDAYRTLDTALEAVPHQICYSVKANSNLSVLQLLAQEGAGFDIVSSGELERVLAAGGRAETIVFSGVGKREDEMRAALEAGIACFNVESPEELDRLEHVAASLGVQAPVALRINPNVDPRTHPYISTGLKENKFGVPHEEVVALYRRIADSPSMQAVGLDCHIGSQLLDLSPMLDALAVVLSLYDEIVAAGIALQHIDLGGGFGIAYQGEQTPDLAAYGQAVANLIGDRSVTILFEPGRSIAGNSGAMLTQVQYRKQNGDKTFVIVDGAMTDLIRPSLYGAYQRILPVARPERCSENNGPAQIVGPVCESGDFLGKDRDLAFLDQGEYLAVLSSGAYGFVMASQYNTRPNPPEILVDGARHRLVRRRQTVAELLDAEIVYLDSES